MRTSNSRWAVLSLAVLLSPVGLVRTAQAQDHVAPLSTLRQDLDRAAGARAANISDIERLLARPEAQQELAKAHLGAPQVQKAVSLMSDDELARLAQHARSADQDVQGGVLKTILAIIGAITVIIILIAVLA